MLGAPPSTPGRRPPWRMQDQPVPCESRPRELPKWSEVCGVGAEGGPPGSLRRRSRSCAKPRALTRRRQQVALAVRVHRLVTNRFKGGRPLRHLARSVWREHLSPDPTERHPCVDTCVAFVESVLHGRAGGCTCMLFTGSRAQSSAPAAFKRLSRYCFFFHQPWGGKVL